MPDSRSKRYALPKFAIWLDAGGNSFKSFDLLYLSAQGSVRNRTTNRSAELLDNSYKFQEESPVHRIECCGEANGAASKLAR